MEPVLFVMAIMGCGDDGGDCRQARIEPVRYTSAAACQAAVPGVLRRSTDVDSPMITAQCQPGGPSLAREQRPMRDSGG